MPHKLKLENQLLINQKLKITLIKLELEPLEIIQEQVHQQEQL